MRRIARRQGLRTRQHRSTAPPRSPGEVRSSSNGLWSKAFPGHLCRLSIQNIDGQKHKGHRLATWTIGAGSGVNVFYAVHPEKVECSSIVVVPPDFCRERPRGLKAGQESVVAEYVVEFGKDGRPVEPDGR